MKIGTVGTNFVVSNFIEAARKISGVEITACYSRNKDTADSFAKKHDIQAVYTDKEAFLQDESLDFVYIAAPNSLHYSWTKDALNAGRNVLCEKPFVSFSQELSELISIAKEKNLFLFEAVTVPHLPNFKLLKNHVGEVGNIKLVQLSFSQYSSRYDAYLRGENPNIFNPEFSGGALMDLNYYNLNFMVGLFGAPQDIAYYPNKADNGIDTSGVLILTYPGFVCTASATKDSKSENSIQLQGDKGYIHIPSVSSLCANFTVNLNDGTSASYNEQEEDNVLYYELVDFTDIVAKGDMAACHALLEHSLIVSNLVEKARKGAGIVFAADN